MKKNQYPKKPYTPFKENSDFVKPLSCFYGIYDKNGKIIQKTFNIGLKEHKFVVTIFENNMLEQHKEFSLLSEAKDFVKFQKIKLSPTLMNDLSQWQKQSNFTNFIPTSN